MLYDRSFAQSTQVHSRNAIPFEYGRVRKVLVQEDLNTLIGMGGERRDPVQFELKWHRNPRKTAETIKNYKNFARVQIENPRLSRTVDEASIDLPSRRETRPHIPGQRQLKMRYIKATPNALGSGQFGEVYKVIDVDSGKFMAVKTLKRKSKQEDWRTSLYRALKREVETIFTISHVSRTPPTSYTYELISVLASYCRLYRVTRLEQTECGDIYGTERRHLSIIGRERSRCACHCGLHPLANATGA
jgi:hypothetical protein